jgi:DNA-binding IclR family transcriptional regulator
MSTLIPAIPNDDREIEPDDIAALDLDDQRPRASGVNAVARAIDILRALGQSSQEMTLLQIAEESGLPRSTVHRIVQTLRDANLVVASSRGSGLRLGPELARIASVSRDQLVPMVRPFLEQLSQLVNEGASLAVLDGEHVRFLDQAIAGQGLRAVSLVGATFPAHCTANGKALLAALPEEIMQATLPARLRRLTDHTIVRREELLGELATVRRTGIAYDREEHADGICAIGVTVHDAVGNFAAITIAVPAQRFYGRENVLAAALSDAGKRVNRALAFAAS